MATERAVLQEALSLMEGAQWCQGWFAKDADGNRTRTAICPEVRSYSITGAIYAATVRLDDASAYKSCCYLIEQQVERGLGGWNDDPTTTFGMVREVFRRAACEAQPKGRVAGWPDRD